MLVLSRKKDESIDIPGVGSLMVVEIRGDKVRLGFSFASEFKIYRREVWRAIQAAAADSGVEVEMVERGRDEETAEVSH